MGVTDLEVAGEAAREDEDEEGLSKLFSGFDWETAVEEEMTGLVGGDGGLVEEGGE